MTLSRATLRTDAWNAVYTYLQTTNPITTNNIFASLNSKLVSETGYPMVVISPPNVSFQNANINGKYQESEVSMLIEIYHTSSASVKSMADEVTNKLLAGKETFAGDRLCNMNIDGGDYDAWEEENKKIHRIGFNVSFRFVG